MKEISFTIGNAYFKAFENEQWIAESLHKRLDTYKGNLDTCIDVGAHVGFWSILAAHMGAKRVFAFEPFCLNFYRLCENIALNDLREIIYPVPLAIGPRDGKTRELRWVPGSYGQASLVYNDDHPLVQQVPTVSLETVIRLAGGRVDVMKMDIEGAEFELLFDASLLRRAGDSECNLLRNIAVLELDIHDVTDGRFFRMGGPPISALVERLKLFGYEERESQRFYRTP